MLFVDWSAQAALQVLVDRMMAAALPKPRVVFFCFRLFHKSRELCEKKDAELFYIEAEVKAQLSSCLTIALCQADGQALRNAVRLSPASTTAPTIHILWPPLRADLAATANAARVNNELAPLCERPYLTCCIRLSPEKAVHRFVDLVRDIGQPTLQSLGLTPVLCGAAADLGYATEIRTALRQAAPQSVIMETFLSTADLANMWRQTRLNIHPSQNEAFGMTIVEAAAFGVPTVLSDDGTVGAADLFNARGEGGADNCACLAAVSDRSSLQATVEQVLQEPHVLEKKGQAAQACALNWQQDSFGQALASILAE